MSTSAAGGSKTPTSSKTKQVIYASQSSLTQNGRYGGRSRSGHGRMEKPKRRHDGRSSGSSRSSEEGRQRANTHGVPPGRDQQDQGSRRQGGQGRPVCHGPLPPAEQCPGFTS